MRLAFLVPFVSLSLSTLACSSDGGPTELEPGPCSAKRTFGDGQTGTCEVTYDADDRPLVTSCTLTYEGGSWTESLTRTYDADGVLTEIATADDDSGNTYDDRWTFADGALAYHGVGLAYDSLTHTTLDERYETDFAGLHWVPQDPFARPSAEDALVASDELREEGDYDPPMMFETHTTYAFDGDPREGTRTRTGSDDSVRTFDYDLDGNLIAEHEYGEYEEVNDGFTYEAGRLIEWLTASDTLTYAWDEFGNLIGSEKVNPGGAEYGYTTELDYSCWDD